MYRHLGQVTFTCTLVLGHTAARVVARLVGHVHAQLGFVARLERSDVYGELLVLQHELLGMHVDVGVATEAVSIPRHVPLQLVPPTLAAAAAAAAAAPRGQPRHDDDLRLAALARGVARLVGELAEGHRREPRLVRRPVQAELDACLPRVAVVEGAAQLAQRTEQRRGRETQLHTPRDLARPHLVRARLGLGPEAAAGELFVAQADRLDAVVGVAAGGQPPQLLLSVGILALLAARAAAEPLVLAAGARLVQ